MQRTTIDFGIDLGTTNSTIAVVEGTDAKVIPNRGGSGLTPSAVWIDKRGNLHVGAEAKQRALIDDAANGDLEFKLRMGLGEDGKKTFERSGRTMLPEELSAEVLKSLKTDVQTCLGEHVGAAVITVPAAFELPQTDATQKAAQLTGFARSPILLEPVAASLAYGFQTERENVYWLVYDFGGGTFDAAIMRVRDGLIQVVNHDGDNHLGGKLFDWDIVTRKLIPFLTSQFDLPDFRRNNPKWRVPLGQMKYHAEQAKIEVCRTKAPCEIWIEALCQDSRGKSIDLSYTLTPADVEEVSKPHIERSLGLCRRTLKEKGLTGASLERVLMVGGTSVNPWVRDAVQAEICKTLEFGIDPVTVVARGAAIFASTQPLPADDSIALPHGTWRIQVEHEPVGNVTDPDIGGRVLTPDGRSPRNFTVELSDTKTRWRSGRIPLGADGVFVTQLFAEQKRRCEYAIELCDPNGTVIPTSPDHVVYTLGIVPDKPPVSSSIGVGLANDDRPISIAKGTRLPHRGVRTYRSIVSLRAGNPEDALHIPVLEGEHARATRNHPIGFLVIKGTGIHRDLPMGSEVEITIFMDESQRLRVQAYVPALDDDFEVQFDLKMQNRPIAELTHEAQAQRERLAKVREAAERTGAAKAKVALSRIHDEQLVDQVDSLLQAAGQDPDALSQLDRRLRDLTAAVDDVEDGAEWPLLLEAAERSRSDADKVVSGLGEPAEKERFRLLESDLQTAIASGDPDLLRQRTEEFDTLWFQVADRQMAYHEARFNRLVGQTASMRDPAQAEQLITQGRRAIDHDDVAGVKVVNRQLISLLPRDTQSQEDARKGDII